MPATPFGANGLRIHLAGRHTWNLPHDFNIRCQSANSKRNGPGECGYCDLVREHRLKAELPGYVLDILAEALKVNVFAREWQVVSQFRFDGKVAFRPIINGLSADQDIWKSGGIPNLKYFRKLLEGEAITHRSDPFCHRPGHLPQVCNPPFCPNSDQRDLPLTSLG